MWFCIRVSFNYILYRGLRIFFQYFVMPGNNSWMDGVGILTTIRAVCKWVLTNMSFSSRAAAIRKHSSPKSQVIFAFVFSWIGDIFVFLGFIFFKLWRVCVFEFNCTRLRAAVDNGALQLSPLYYDRGQQVAHSGRPHAESIIFNRGRSVAMWTFTGRVFHPAQRPPPVERAPA